MILICLRILVVLQAECCKKMFSSCASSPFIDFYITFQTFMLSTLQINISCKRQRLVRNIFPQKYYHYRPLLYNYACTEKNNKEKTGFVDCPRIFKYQKVEVSMMNSKRAVMWVRTTRPNQPWYYAEVR